MVMIDSKELSFFGSVEDGGGGRRRAEKVSVDGGRYPVGRAGRQGGSGPWTMERTGRAGGSLARPPRARCVQLPRSLFLARSRSIIHAYVTSLLTNREHPRPRHAPLYSSALSYNIDRSYCTGIQRAAREAGGGGTVAAATTAAGGARRSACRGGRCTHRTGGPSPAGTARRSARA